MACDLRSYWITVGFAAHCARLLCREVAGYEFEPAWHRLAISQAAECARLRALLGGSADDDAPGHEGVLIVEGQYFDHYDIDALQGALSQLLNCTANTAAEVDDELEVKVLHAATNLTSLALDSAFSQAARQEVFAETMQWMAFAGAEFERKAVYGSAELESAARHLSSSELERMPVALDLLLQRCL